MNYTLGTILTFTIVVPAIIGLVRFSKIHQAYYPFIFCIWLGLINETIGTIVISLGYYNIINFNIYLLIESILITWQFKNWNLFQKRKIVFPAIISGLIIFWTINTAITNMKDFNSYFMIGYSFLISIMSISVFNRLIITERKSLIKNPVFIICVAYVIFYTSNVLSESFWLYSFKNIDSFALGMNSMSMITNFFTIILYTFAILWMPKKQKFTLPSS